MADLCLTLAETSLEGLNEKILRHNGQVEMIETRLDYLINPQVPELPPEPLSRYLATCRPTREGGKFEGTEEDRIALLQKAARTGFELIDLECDVELRDLPRAARAVRSFHDFKNFTNNLDSLFQRIMSRSGDIHKLALRVSSTRQLVQLLTWMEQLPARPPRVVIGMGRYGKPSRFLGGALGNAWTYVSESSDEKVAPGQFGLPEAKEVYRLAGLSSSSKLYGFLTTEGHTPNGVRIFNLLFQNYCKDHYFFPIPIDDFQAWVDYLSRTKLDFRGFLVDPLVAPDEYPGGDADALFVAAGLEIRAEQIAAQFYSWTEIEPDPDLLQQLCDSEFGDRRASL